ncbi:MAG: LysM peptidoglycan-binding domain-containing protein [Cocleimonas sp.]|nr:LysM peptidoglycan-binding domain-containing protein [Cocleimonas sp.]
MSLPRLAILSATSLLLSVGCNNKYLKSENNKTSLSTVPAVPDRKIDLYDQHYGKPKPRDRHDNGGYSSTPKYKKIGHKRIPIKSDAPIRYKVKKGDTLWGISNKFLKDPWFWPEIWDKNQKIKNPHLIFPNDVLYIYQSRRKVTRGGRIEEILVPQIRVERSDKKMGEPIAALAPFLAWPRVLAKDMIDKAPYIVDGKNDHLLISNGQTVYIKNLNNRREAQSYSVFHTEKKLYDPQTKELLGYEVSYSADAEITQAKGNIASATILNMRRAVRIGDRLLKNIDETIKLKGTIRAPHRKVRASIISLYDAKLISGKGMIIAFNAGRQKGIKVGHILGVYAQGKTVTDPYAKIEKVDYKYIKTKTPVRIDLPPERIATAIVYKVDDKLSYALITKSDHIVKKGYKIGNP